MMVLAENMNDDIVLGERNVDKLNMLCGTQKTISSMFGWNYPGENIIENINIQSNQQKQGQGRPFLTSKG
jgi:hypothetical protein